MFSSKASGATVIIQFFKTFESKITVVNLNMGSTPIPHILELSRKEKQDFLDSFDIIFTDCDGVIWESTTQRKLDRIADGLNLLENHGKEIIYLTNNSIRSPEGFRKQFESVGLHIDLVNNLVYPLRCIIDYLKEIKFDDLIYCIATQSFKDALIAANFKVIDGPNKSIAESFTDLARNVFDSQPVRAVIVDVDLNMSSAKLIRGQVYLRNPECILIGGAADTKVPFGPMNTIGPGAFLKILEKASNRKAITFGKPGVALVTQLIHNYKITEPKRVLVIGDSLESDIAFGKFGGFQTLAVLTGATGADDLSNILDESYRPDYYADSVADFVKFFDDVNIA